MSLINDVLQFVHSNPRQRFDQRQITPRERARQHIDRIFTVADKPTKKLLWQLDYLITCPDEAKRGEAQALADQINAWCQGGEEVLTGRTLMAAVCEVFEVGGLEAA
ncbi:MAG TPA: hypothetical protein VJ835_01115 [Fimbriimonadaceae bacterium]|nr:hypothetical protein [Fimbriimonadaceae bacterium]